MDHSISNGLDLHSVMDNNSELCESIQDYFQGQLTTSTDISYEWVKSDENIFALCQCFTVSIEDIDLMIERRDFSCEFKLLKLITDDRKHKDQLIQIPKGYNKFNRYSDMLPYAFNTVYTQEEKIPKNYLNASYIQGPFQQDKNLFIATQGPLGSTVEHFWTMVMNRKVSLILMLSNLLEEGRTKCESYWPKNEDTPLVFMNFRVTFESEFPLLENALIERHFQIINEDTQTTLNVTQLHVLCWPDHSAPSEELGFKMIELLLSYVDDFRAQFTSSPVVVHCSAGVGRTGTFMAIYNITKCLVTLNSFNKKTNGKKIEPFMNVFNVARKLREQRYSMITDGSQYKYIYEFGFEWIKRNFE